MKTRSLLLASGAALLVVGVFVLSDEEDQSVVEDLARKQSQSESSISLDKASAEFLPLSWELTTALKASKNGARETWFVQSDESQTLIQLPFPPEPDGMFPANQETGSPPMETNPGYVGADACAECHPKKHAGFAETAHYNSSGLATRGRIKGHFVPPRNSLTTSDQDLSQVS